jgi:hypothetical protein
MKNGKFFVVGMLVIALAFGFVLIGCPMGSDDEKGNSEVKSLPSFEGQFVGSEAEASALASGAEAQIQLAIAEALEQGPRSNIGMSRAAVSENGHYTYNGVTVDYTVTGDIDSDTYPFSYTVKERVAIDGTYAGYKIKGRYNLNLNYTVTSETVSSIKYDYDCVYAVSYGGKGMKLVYTGNLVITSAPEYIYNVHYAVYDNNNALRYNYDYKYPQ